MNKTTLSKQKNNGGIPEGWEIKPAEEFCQRVTDGTHDSPKKQPTGRYLVTSRHLKGHNLDFDNAYFISEEDYNDINRRSKVDQWDVIFSMIGTIGDIYLERNVSIDYVIKNVGLFKLGGDVLKGKWLYYYFQSRQAKEYINGSRAGTTQEYMTLESLRKFPVRFPRNKKQMEWIIGLLECINAKIELNHQMNKTLEQIAQAIFKQWFVDFEFPGHEKTKFIDDLPEGWETSELRKCGQIICGKTPPTQDKENYGFDIPFITIPDMRGQVFVINTERKLSKKGAELQKNKTLPALSVCVSCIATPGLISLTSEVSQTNQQINSIICQQDVSPYFMYLAMLDKSEEIKARGLGGTATLNLNTGDFAKIKITVPNRTIMNTFHEVVISIFEKLLSNARESMALGSIRDSLLPRLMSGKIRVK